MVQPTAHVIPVTAKILKHVCPHFQAFVKIFASLVLHKIQNSS